MQPLHAPTQAPPTPPAAETPLSPVLAAPRLAPAGKKPGKSPVARWARRGAWAVLVLGLVAGSVWFVRPWLGLLLTATTGSSLGGADPAVSRHILGFEVESLPLHIGMFHLGGYANVGAGATTFDQSELATVVGGGALAELDLTGRMSLTLRGGVNNFYYQDTGFASSAAMFTAGLAVY